MQKHEHKIKQIKLWCKTILQIDVEHIFQNIELFYFYLYPFGDLSSLKKSFHKNFHHLEKK